MYKQVSLQLFDVITHRYSIKQGSSLINNISFSFIGLGYKGNRGTSKLEKVSTPGISLSSSCKTEELSKYAAIRLSPVLIF